MINKIIPLFFYFAASYLAYTGSTSAWAESELGITHRSEESLISSPCIGDALILAQVDTKARRNQATAKTHDKQRIKITRIDRKQGIVNAIIVESGEPLTVKLALSAIEKQKLRAGQLVSIKLIAAGAKGRCKCGQKIDGSCWCTGELPCCGPLHGCPIASCGGKKGPTGVKPQFETR